LLDLISARRHNGIASGGIFYGSRSVSQASSWLRHNCAYVLQLGEPWVGTLTVYDELMLAAALRLPVTTSFTERSARVHEVIQLVGLSNHAHTKIGSNTSLGGLSGGQKRRFSIALQMLKKPTLFFLE
jgi:ABC-type multidrug transport system ATPase subunit